MQLIVENLVQVRGGRTIIDHLSFCVAGSETLVLTGPNGAGKTTLLRTLTGFLRPEAGKIRLDGGDPERELAEQCHFIGHLNGTKSNLTVAENLTFWAEFLDGLKGPDVAGRVANALEAFEIAHLGSIPAGYLSAGQKRRVALARLMVTWRPLWLLDEPTSSLDTTSATLVRDAIDAHVARGGLAIAATHLPLGLKSTRELRLGPAAEAA